MGFPQMSADYLESNQVADLEDEAITCVTSLQASDLMVRHQRRIRIGQMRSIPRLTSRKKREKCLRANWDEAVVSP